MIIRSKLTPGLLKSIKQGDIHELYICNQNNNNQVTKLIIKIEGFVKEKENLIKYLFPDVYYGDVFERLEDVPKIMSIGRMIEFLDKHNVFSRIDRDELWEVQVEPRGKESLYWFGHNDFELCDALWEACKEILTKEDSSPTLLSPEVEGGLKVL